MKKSALVFCSVFLSFCSLVNRDGSSDSCSLSPQDYSVQSVTYDRNSGSYELMILEAPPCFKNPLHLDRLKLARMEQKENENALLDFNNPGEPSLFIAHDFQIRLVESYSRGSGNESRTGSFWSPFLAGTVGAAAGSLLMNKLFRKPQYVTPPPAQKGKTKVTGVGSYGPTKEAAFKSYQRKYSTRDSGQMKKSFFRKKTTSRLNTRKHRLRASRKGFFRLRRR